MSESVKNISDNDAKYTVLGGERLAAGFVIYGIAAFVSGVMVDSVADYDTDKTFVCKVAARLNAGKAQLCHFKDILEDELVAKSC